MESLSLSLTEFAKWNEHNYEIKRSPPNETECNWLFSFRRTRPSFYLIFLWLTWVIKRVIKTFQGQPCVYYYLLFLGIMSLTLSKFKSPSRGLRHGDREPYLHSNVNQSYKILLYLLKIIVKFTLRRLHVSLNLKRRAKRQVR